MSGQNMSKEHAQYNQQHSDICLNILTMPETLLHHRKLSILFMAEKAIRRMACPEMCYVGCSHEPSGLMLAPYHIAWDYLLLRPPPNWHR